MGVGPGFAVDIFAGDKAHADTLRAAVIENVLETVVGAVAGDRNIVKAASTALECFANGMNAVDHFAHSF